MEDKELYRLSSLVLELTFSQKRRLRSIFMSGKDEAVEQFSDLVCTAVLEPGEQWWLDES